MPSLTSECPSGTRWGNCKSRSRSRPRTEPAEGGDGAHHPSGAIQPFSSPAGVAAAPRLLFWCVGECSAPGASAAMSAGRKLICSFDHCYPVEPCGNLRHRQGPDAMSPAQRKPMTATPQLRKSSRRTRRNCSPPSIAGSRRRSSRSPRTYDHADRYPAEIVEQMKELGLFGATIGAGVRRARALPAAHLRQDRR